MKTSFVIPLAAVAALFLPSLGFAQGMLVPPAGTPAPPVRPSSGVCFFRLESKASTKQKQPGSLRRPAVPEFSAQMD